MSEEQAKQKQNAIDLATEHRRPHKSSFMPWTLQLSIKVEASSAVDATMAMAVDAIIHGLARRGREHGHGRVRRGRALVHGLVRRGHTLSHSLVCLHDNAQE